MMPKAGFREAARLRRSQMSPEERRRSSEAVSQRLSRLDVIRPEATVCFYLATAEEVETRPLVGRALEVGCRVVVPRVAAEGRLELYPIEALEGQVELGAFGIEEPRLGAASPLEAEAVDCFIVPGVAFDPSGRRCGTGRGYFDRLLSRRAPESVVVALAFECQLQPALPAEEHDVPMDFICTERRILDCRRQSGGPLPEPQLTARKEKEVETL